MSPAGHEQPPRFDQLHGERVKLAVVVRGLGQRIACGGQLRGVQYHDVELLPLVPLLLGFGV